MAKGKGKRGKRGSRKKTNTGATAAEPKRKRKGRRKGSGKGRKRSGAKRSGKRGAVSRAEFNGLKNTVEGHTKELRHHRSYLGAIVNGLRRNAGLSKLKDPVAKPAATALPSKAFTKLGR